MKKETFTLLSSMIPILLFFNIVIFKEILIANIIISIAIVIISIKLVSEVIKLKNNTH
ncbi:hypothetical protein GCM10008904_00450 [Paraclostridium ghonii]|uniref:Uncharacterized protein n=1 Tax=Paraclostridium ghonii TaxID=29358 RepID=A0ABU0MY63_9FIRM|nr:hypothetical protein [Paeniclostridium ghonii]MDQ0555852.1 hypothetical protein [Paeniclostridium ghonii]